MPKTATDVNGNVGFRLNTRLGPRKEENLILFLFTSPDCKTIVEREMRSLKEGARGMLIGIERVTIPLRTF